MIKFHLKIFLILNYRRILDRFHLPLSQPFSGENGESIEIIFGHAGASCAKKLQG